MKEELINKPSGWKTRLKTAFLFVFFAVPGVLMFTFSWILLLASIFKVDKNLPHPIKMGLFCIVGMIFMLVGLGKWGQWRYFLVFLSMPIVFCLSALLIIPLSDGKESILLLALFACPILFALSSWVRDYYARAEESNKESDS
jgi:hypothetical protein